MRASGRFRPWEGFWHALPTALIRCSTLLVGDDAVVPGNFDEEVPSDNLYRRWLDENGELENQQAKVLHALSTFRAISEINSRRQGGRGRFQRVVRLPAKAAWAAMIGFAVLVGHIVDHSGVRHFSNSSSRAIDRTPRT